MKKKIFITSILLITLIGILFSSQGRTRDINDLIDDTILGSYEESTTNGSIIFTITSDKGNSYLRTIVANKNLFGYKEIYSGVASIDDMVNPITIQYFPRVKNTPLPISFGVILDDNITSVAIKGVDNSFSKEANIVEINNKKLWFIYMDDFNGKTIEVLGYNSGDESVYKTNIPI